jgi:putative nucleotidyltransferase with HDIG domain
MAKFDEATESRVNVDQLQPGVFIQLENNWFSHPFLFSKFKIKDHEQINTLKALGIKDVVYIPEKSDCLPKLIDKVSSGRKHEQPRARSVPEDPYLQLLWQVKKDRIQKLKEKQKSLRRCTNNYDRTVKCIPHLMTNVMAGSPEAVASSQEMMGAIVKVFLGDMDALVHLINAKETGEGIYHHSLNVSVLALMLGRKAKLTEVEMHCLGMGAMFHDLGKSRIEKKILRKPPPHTKAELELIQRHPQYGVDLVRRSGVFPEDAAQVIFQHHEQYSGQGYPQHLNREEIDKLARITAIVDAYDNLCNNVDLERCMTPYNALSHMYTKLQGHFDMELFSLFIRSLGIYPPGTVVKLSNGLIGIVISVNPQNALKPSLMLYDPKIPKEEALMIEMEDDPDVTIETSIQPNMLPDEIRLYLCPKTGYNYYMDASPAGNRS